MLIDFLKDFLFQIVNSIWAFLSHPLFLSLFGLYAVIVLFIFFPKIINNIKKKESTIRSSSSNQASDSLPSYQPIRPSSAPTTTFGGSGCDFGGGCDGGC